MRNLKKLFILCSLVLVFTLILANGALAAGTGNETIMSSAADKAIKVFKHVKGIIFVIGGFGLVGIAFQAIFGKIKWSWFAGLAVGLAILAAAGAIVEYATGTTPGADAGLTDADANLGDSFGSEVDGGGSSS